MELEFMYDFTLQKIKDGWPYKDVPEGFHEPEFISNKTIWVSAVHKHNCERVNEDEHGQSSYFERRYTSRNWCGFVEANLE